MMRECPCSTKTREVLGNLSPTPLRFPSTVSFAPLNPRDFPWVSWCKTHGLGKSLGFPSTLEISLGLRPREISWVSGNWAAGMDFPIPPSSWWSTDTFPHHHQGRIDFNTVNLCHSTLVRLVWASPRYADTFNQFEQPPDSWHTIKGY